MKLFLFIDGSLVIQTVPFDVITGALAGLTTISGSAVVAIEESADLRLVNFDQTFQIISQVKIATLDWDFIAVALEAAWSTGITALQISHYISKSKAKLNSKQSTQTSQLENTEIQKQPIENRN